MRLRGYLLGIVGGLLLGGGMVALRGPLVRPGARPTPLAEDHGRITRVVMQYQPDAGPLVAPIYAQFLTALGTDVEVVWVVNRQADADELRTRLGAAWPAGHCRTVVVGKPITTWAKDRFVALAWPGGAGVSVACAPARTRSGNPLRTNDQEVPFRLALAERRQFDVRGTDAFFDGGDFLATRRHLFAGPAIMEKNPPGPGARFTSTAALTSHLAQKLSGKITWLLDDPRRAPPHHLGMFLTVMGPYAAVGDVRLAERLTADHRADTLAALRKAGGEASPAFRAALQADLDRVARRLRALGYRVVRVPLLPSATPRAWMAYNNGIVETRGGKTIFYMPTFGAQALDAAAAASFHRQLGCTVTPIDCAAVWPLGGSLHCLVNIVARAG